MHYYVYYASVLNVPIRHSSQTELDQLEAIKEIGSQRIEVGPPNSSSGNEKENHFSIQILFKYIWNITYNVGVAVGEYVRHTQNHTIGNIFGQDPKT